MSDRFTKGKISLVLTVVHMCLIHPQIFVYLMMYGRSYPELILILFNLIFFFFSRLVQDYRVNSKKS